MNKKRMALLVAFCAPSLLHAQWAHLYHKKITESESQRAAEHNGFYFSKSDLERFSQLLLSWNALRPQRGYFIFLVQARNVRTGTWGRWHRMMEWGSDLQQSHATRSDGFTKYLHVRLETEPFQFADAFRIKVMGAKGASLSLLKSVAVTTINMNKFTPEKVTRELSQLHSTYVHNVPKISQISLHHEDNHRMCSPVSCATLSRFLTKQWINPVHFARNSFDKGLNSYGSWPFNTAHLFEQAHGKGWFYHTRLNSFKEIHAQLQRGIPTIVSIRGKLRKAPQPYPHGHLLTVIGYDAKTQEVICHDSAKEGHNNVEQRYSLAEFVRSWEASRRLAYWVERV